MIRTVVVGFGRFGRIYAERAREHAELDVVGVVELGPVLESVRAAGFRGFGTIGEAISVAHPRLVVIATPPERHAELAIEALTRHVDVLLAKPGALSVDEAERVSTTAWSVGRRVVVDYTPTESPEWDALRRGDYAEGIYTARLVRRGWSAYQPCGALWDLAPHDVALALELDPDDRVESVSARGWGIAGYDEPLGAWLHLSHASGRTTRIEVDWISPTVERRVEIVTPYRTHVWDQLEDTPADPDNVSRALSRTVAAIRGGVDDSERLLDVTRILEAAERSIHAAEGTRVAA